MKDVRALIIDGIRLLMADIMTSAVRGLVLKDLKEDVYGLDRIQFRPGDQVIDIGANIGMISIYLAKKYPGIKVFAFEPMPENFMSLTTNIQMNGVQGIVIPSCKAVTCDGRDLEMIAHMESNTGGATGFLEDMNLPDHQKAIVHSCTLEDIFRDHITDRCKLLKMDCEGAEHEIIECSGDLLHMVDYMSAELHINFKLASTGHSLENTLKCIRSKIPESRLSLQITTMAN